MAWDKWSISHGRSVFKEHLRWEYGVNVYNIFFMILLSLKVSFLFHEYLVCFFIVGVVVNEEDEDDGDVVEGGEG